MDISNIRSIKNSENYKWGENNNGWHLLKDDELSVIEERMSPGTSERLHLHKKSQQLFYILDGKAGFEIGESLLELVNSESMHILPGIPHRIFNNGEADLRFIVISSPKSHGDRIEL